MSILAAVTSIFSSGVMGTVERIATEAIETNTEKAEAQTVLIKALDPNGIMRRELARFASVAYGYYLFITSSLILFHSFGVGSEILVDAAGNQTVHAPTEVAITAMSELFLPLTAAWGTITTAAFGVNYANIKQGK